MTPIHFFLTNRNLKDLNPLGGGDEYVAKGRRVPLGVRQNIVIHYVLSGKGEYTVKGKTYSVFAGDSFILYPEYPSTYVADKEDPWHYQWIHFDGELSSRFLELPPVFKVSPIHFKRIFTYIQDEAMCEYRIAGQLFEMYAELFTDIPRRNKYINQISSYIQNNFMNKITVEDIAKQYNLDRRYISWRFKQETGQSIKEYLTSVRLDWARYYLKKGYSVKETSMFCGYDDVCNFSKLFKKIYHISPRDWRLQSPVTPDHATPDK